jgi:exonuclease VII large subunit
MVADASASTPTAAAHVVNGSWDRLRKLDEQAQLLAHRYESSIATLRADITGHAHRLSTQLARLSGTADRYQQRLEGALAAIGERMVSMRDTVMRAERQLTASSPERLLGLGYSIVTGPDGAVVRSAKQLRHDQEVTTRLGSGAFVSVVKELTSK